MANSVFVPFSFPLQTTETNPVTVAPIFAPELAVQAQVIVGATSVELLPLNLDRRRLVLYNPAASPVNILFGSVASLTAYSFRLEANETYHGPLGDYTGPVSAIRDAATGRVQVTEIRVA